ncbi:MAG: hypothetical protein Q9223_004263 [Gallowayella weberi]
MKCKHHQISLVEGSLTMVFQSSRSVAWPLSLEAAMPGKRCLVPRMPSALTLQIAELCTQVVIIQPLDSGSKSHSFPHALVAGIERYPSGVTRRMSKARQAKRSKVKPFIKIINYNHIMPTRYTLELEGLKNVITNDTFKEPSQREEAKKTVKKSLEERYTTGKNRWFFTPLSEFVLPFEALECDKIHEWAFTDAGTGF